MSVIPELTDIAVRKSSEPFHTALREQSGRDSRFILATFSGDHGLILRDLFPASRRSIAGRLPAHLLRLQAPDCTQRDFQKDVARWLLVVDFPNHSASDRFESVQINSRPQVFEALVEVITPIGEVLALDGENLSG